MSASTMSFPLENRVICKYNLRGMCRFGGRCRNIHEDPDKLVEKMMMTKISESNSPDCQQEGACALSPTKPKQTPTNSCKENFSGPSTSAIESLVSEVEEKTCGICFDIILKKVNRFEQTFGLLPNCNHCFCFACIRKWRQSKEFELEVSKACPECRVASDYVYPTKFWIENKDDKVRFISNQKQRMKKIDCRYFRKGKGKCPFGNTCLYLHALPNGKVLDVGPPRPRRGRGASGEELVHQILFWLNDDDLDHDTDDSDDDLDDFDLDLDDPCIAYQYYERGDIRRYLALDQLMGCDSDRTDDDFDLFFV